MVLYSFFEKTEREVFDAIEKIYEYLKDEENYIPIDQYGKLANFLIAARECIDDNSLIDKCKQEILKKVHSARVSNKQFHRLTYHDGIELWTDDQKQEFADYKEKLLTRTKQESVVALGKIASPDDVKKLSSIVYDNIEKYVGSREFAGKLDIEGLLKIFPLCAPKVIEGLRGAIMAVYRSVNIRDFLASDVSALTSLKNGISRLFEEGKIDDKVKGLQLKWFTGNLEEIIKILS